MFLALNDLEIPLVELLVQVETYAYIRLEV